MFEIMIGEDFSAAHKLRNYKGKCETLHGHNYKVWIKVSAPHLDKRGLAVDFKDLKQILKSVLLKLDHAYLNELAPFKKHNPTSEVIAKYIFDKIAGQLKKSYPHLILAEVEVWETDKACAIYRKR